MRRFCLALLGGNALATVAFTAYTAAGIDALTQHYIGYFYWSAPALTLLVILLAGHSVARRWAVCGAYVPARCLACDYGHFRAG